MKNNEVVITVMGGTGCGTYTLTSFLERVLCQQGFNVKNEERLELPEKFLGDIDRLVSKNISIKLKVLQTPRNHIIN